MVLDCHFAYLHFIIKCEVLEVFVWIYGSDSSGVLKKVANKEYYTFYTSQVGFSVILLIADSGNVRNKICFAQESQHYTCLEILMDRRLVAQ